MSRIMNRNIHSIKFLIRAFWNIKLSKTYRRIKAIKNIFTSLLKITPTNKDLEKSVLGKNNNPKQSPIIIKSKDLQG